MKKNNRGFMLVETLIVTTFVAGVLIFLFIQFNSLNSSYKESFKYNNVEKLYALQDISKYIISDTNALTYLKNTLSTDINSTYINITNCNNDIDILSEEVIFLNDDYCSKLIKSEQVKQLIFTKQNLNSFNNNNLSEKMKIFINKIKYDKGDDINYRIIAEFNDGDFATILVK